MSEILPASPRRRIDGEAASRRRARREAVGLPQSPWRNLVNPYEPIEVLTAEQLERVHDTSMRILETHGLEFLNDAALDILVRAGADVDRGTRRVRFDRRLVAEYVAKAPAQFTLHARNPAHSVTIGGNHIAFCAVSSAPNCSDLDRGRRPGTYADYCDLLRIVQSLNVIHLASGYPVEPIDIPPPIRHLDAYHAAITLTDRVWSPSAIGGGRVEDGLAMAGPWAWALPSSPSAAR